MVQEALIRGPEASDPTEPTAVEGTVVEDRAERDLLAAQATQVAQGLTLPGTVWLRRRAAGAGRWDWSRSAVSSSLART